MLFYALVEHTSPLKRSLIAHFAIFVKDSLFWLGIPTSPQINLWCHMNAKYWRCDMILVDCSCMHRLTQRRSSLRIRTIYLDFVAPSFHHLAYKIFHQICITMEKLCWNVPLELGSRDINLWHSTTTQYMHSCQRICQILPYGHIWDAGTWNLWWLKGPWGRPLHILTMKCFPMGTSEWHFEKLCSRWTPGRIIV